MRIDQQIPPPIGRIRPHPPLAPDAGFARLLEDGASAESVSARRALSFAETGLLGVHQALEIRGSAVVTTHCTVLRSNSGTPRASLDASALRSEAAADPANSATRPFGVASQMDCLAKAPSQEDGFVSPASRQDEAQGQIFAGNCRSEPRPNPEIEGVVANLSALSSRPERRRRDGGPAVRFRLTEAEVGAVAIVSDLPIEGTEAVELAALVEEVGREFGVKIVRVVCPVASNK